MRVQALRLILVAIVGSLAWILTSLGTWSMEWEATELLRLPSRAEALAAAESVLDAPWPAVVERSDETSLVRRRWLGLTEIEARVVPHEDGWVIQVPLGLGPGEYVQVGGAVGMAALLTWVASGKLGLSRKYRRPGGPLRSRPEQPGIE